MQQAATSNLPSVRWASDKKEIAKETAKEPARMSIEHTYQTQPSQISPEHADRLRTLTADLQAAEERRALAPAGDAGRPARLAHKLLREQHAEAIREVVAMAQVGRW